MEVPGSEVGTDGLFIPAEQVASIQRLLSLGHHHNSTYRQELRERDQREQAATHRAMAAEAQAQHILDYFDTLFEGGGWQDWASDTAAKWGVLKADARAKGLEVANRQLTERLDAHDRERDEQRLQPRADAALEEAVLSFGTEAGLSQADMIALYERLASPDFRSLWLVQAPEDIPEEGIKRGQRVINYDAVRAEVLWLQKQRGPQPARTGGPAPKKSTPPPTPSAKRGPAPGKATKRPDFKTQDEVFAWIDKGGHLEE